MGSKFCFRRLCWRAKPGVIRRIKWIVDLDCQPQAATPLGDHHVISVAVIIAVGVNTNGRREVLGMTVGHSEAEPFWTEFLRSLARRGLRGIRLVISDAHEGLKAAITKVLSAT